MRLKIAIALLVLLGVLIGGFYMLGFRLRVGKDKLHTASRLKGPPLATVRLLDPSSKRVSRSTDIRAFNDLYAALGVTSSAFAQWEKDNGYGSFGKNERGELFVRGFPIFSKVAWMYIDPVYLSPQEVKQLVQECTDAEGLTENAVAREEFSRIRLLAQEALSMSAPLRFDQP